MNRLVIVRHGNTFEAGEVPRRIGSRTDLPLTATGEAQAEALGALFSGSPFTRALSGPLQRTRRTAETILQHQPAPPPLELSDLLLEIDHGPDEDRTETDVLARIGADALAQWETSLVAPPGWKVDTERRVMGWRALFAEHRQAGGDWLLVTSNGAARFALKALEGAGNQPHHKLRTGAFGEIGTGENTHYHVISWDRRP